MKKNTNKQSFMKKVLTSEGYKNFKSSLLAIAIGFTAGFLVLVVSSPSKAIPGMAALLSGSLSRMGTVLYQATPIIMTGMSVGFAYKTGLFNIGTPGQFMIGSFLAVYMSITLEWVPKEVRWIVCLILSACGGAVWGMIPGLLKAFRNVNEVISSIMMNYIGMYLVNHTIMNSTIYDSTRALSRPPAVFVPAMGLDRIFPNTSVNGGTFVVIGISVLIWVILTKTVYGFELRTCGFNASAGRYAGVNEKLNIVSAMMIAGALAALGGGLYFLSNSGRFMSVIDKLPTQGFDGIPVALLALNNPIGIVFTGIFIAYLHDGGYLIQSYRIMPEIADIVIAAIIYCSAFSKAIRLFFDYRKLHSNVNETPMTEDNSPNEEDGI